MSDFIVTVVTALATFVTILLSSALVYFTRQLWKATEIHSEATKAAADATKKHADAYILQTQLDYQTRLEGQWILTGGEEGKYFPVFEIIDHRKLPMRIDAIRLGVSDWGAVKPPSLVDPVHYTTNRRDDETIAVSAEGYIPIVPSSHICVGIVHYRDLATNRNRILRVYTDITVDSNNNVHLDPHTHHDPGLSENQYEADAVDA